MWGPWVDLEVRGMWGVKSRLDSEERPRVL